MTGAQIKFELFGIPRQVFMGCIISPFRIPKKAENYLIFFQSFLELCLTIYKSDIKKKVQENLYKNFKRTKYETFFICDLIADTNKGSLKLEK